MPLLAAGTGLISRCLVLCTAVWPALGRRKIWIEERDRSGEGGGSLARAVQGPSLVALDWKESIPAELEAGWGAFAEVGTNQLRYR